MKKLLMTLFIFMNIIGTVGMSEGFTTNSPTESDKMRMIIQGQVSQIAFLKAEVSQLRSEKDKIEQEVKECKFVIYTVEALTTGAVASRWADPNHIRDVRDACKKYEYLIKDVREKKHANWQFVMARCLATGLDPNFHCDKDGNGMYDNGVADLNDSVLKDTEKYLPKELRLRSWYNIEKSVAGLYVWIKRREDMRMPWAYLGNEQWRYYGKIKGS